MVKCSSSMLKAPGSISNSVKKEERGEEETEGRVEKGREEQAGKEKGEIKGLP